MKFYARVLIFLTLLSPAGAHAQFNGCPPGFCGGGGTGSGPPAVTATFDPVHSSTNMVLSNGNLTATSSLSGTYYTATATVYKSAGKFYCEMSSGSVQNTDTVGIQNFAAPVDVYFPGADLNGIGWFTDGRVLINGSTVATIATWTSLDAINIAVDFTNQMIWFRKGAGNWNNNPAADPATNVGGISIATLNAGPYTPAYASGFSNGGSNLTANFGATAYTQAVPAGYGNWAN